MTKETELEDEVKSLTEDYKKMSKLVDRYNIKAIWGDLNGTENT